MELTEGKIQEYIDNEGTKCPLCGGESFVGGFVEVDGSEASQTVRCLACDGSWDVVFQLSGVRNVVDPMQEYEPEEE